MTIKTKKIVSIHGVPRSGTSWLGHIFNSHPDVAFRFQPLFAYRFKDRINLNSTRDEIYEFLDELYNCKDDDFILNVEQAREKIHPSFIKSGEQNYLVMKMVRYHHLIKKFIDEVSGMKIIGIVRNPLAVINSWLQAPKEFKKEWNPLEEWRYAAKKNLGRIEEFNGYEKWKETTLMFIGLQEEYPGSFYLLKYEDLVDDAAAETEKVFEFAGLEMHAQVAAFLEASQKEHNNHPYAVFKDASVKSRWQEELDEGIANQIIRDIKGTKLGRFL